MKSQVVLGICITLFLMAGVASAATVWNPAANGITPPAIGDWSEAANWTNDVPGIADNKAVFNVDGAAECVVSDTQTLGDLVQGDGGPGGVIRIVEGGSLTTTGGWMAVGYNNTAKLIVERGGVCNFGSHLWWGMHTGAIGTIEINGGTITGGRDFGLGWWFGPADDHGQAEVYVKSGVLNIHHWDDTNAIYDGSFIDVQFGTVNITNDGNQVDAVLAFADSGKILAFGGVGTLNVVHTDGVTTITADHPLNQFPTYDSIVPPGDLELSWTLPDPCEAGQPVPVDVYLTDDYDALAQFTDPAAIRVVNNQAVTSVVVQVQTKTRYYWAVDTYVGSAADPVFGPISSFVVDNPPPAVDAGVDLLTWLGEDGSRMKNLDATVIDNGAYTVQWTVVSEPNDPNNPDAVIADLGAEDTSITLSALGEYVLQLDAFDGEYTGSDSVTINVYEDGCQAARSLPDYVPFPGDLNGDCKVDELDMAILEEDWLKDNSLTEP